VIRRAAQSASMTSLIDVLFILLFAALVSSVDRTRARAAEPEPVTSASARPAGSASASPPGPAASGPSPSATASAPAVPASSAPLRARAVGALARLLSERRAHYVRVSAEGILTAIESEGAGEIVQRDMAVPLLARVADPDVVLEYLGDRNADLRICSLVLRETGGPDLRRDLIVILPERSLATLPLALARGLVSDVERCSVQQGLAVVVDPEQR
jgi:hypothetical protein